MPLLPCDVGEHPRISRWYFDLHRGYRVRATVGRQGPQWEDHLVSPLTRRPKFWLFGVWELGSLMSPEKFGMACRQFHYDCLGSEKEVVTLSQDVLSAGALHLQRKERARSGNAQYLQVIRELSDVNQ